MIVREDGIFSPDIAVDQLINPNAFWLFGKDKVMFPSTLYIINFFLHGSGQSPESFVEKIEKIAQYLKSWNATHEFEGKTCCKMWWRTITAIRNFNQNPGYWSTQNNQRINYLNQESAKTLEKYKIPLFDTYHIALASPEKSETHEENPGQAVHYGPTFNVMVAQMILNHMCN
jgi:hypothetical protein